MIPSHRVPVAAAAIMILVLCWPEMRSAQAAKMYRYHNDQGVLVIDHTVPADAAARGYEIQYTRCHAPWFPCRSVASRQGELQQVA